MENFVSLSIFEFLDRLDEPDIAFLDEIEEVQTAIRIFLGDRNHESQIRLDEPVFRVFHHDPASVDFLGHYDDGIGVRFEADLQLTKLLFGNLYLPNAFLDLVRTEAQVFFDSLPLFFDREVAAQCSQFAHVGNAKYPLDPFLFLPILSDFFGRDYELLGKTVDLFGVYFRLFEPFGKALTFEGELSIRKNVAAARHDSTFVFDIILEFD